MGRIALLLALVLAAGAGVYLLLGGGGGGAIDEADDRESELAGPGADLEAPGLHGLPGARRPAPTNGRQPEIVVQPPGEPEPPAEVVLRVTVLDDATGAPLPHARLWWEDAREPCPRLPDEGHISPPPSPLSSQAVRAHAPDAEGRFALDTSLLARPGAESLDVFASHEGYVIGIACAVRLPGEVTIRLKRGLTLRGSVTDQLGRPLADAILLARPGAATAPVPGHGGWAATNEQGEFKMDGLLEGALNVRVGREGYFPLELPAEDPVDTRPRTYALTPAFVLRFRLRTDDGRPVVNPSVRLVWGTRPPVEKLELVQLLGDETSDGILTQGISLPATVPSVRIEVKAEGYATWVRAEEPVPPEGGERTLNATLGRDTSQGGLRLVLEDERGQRLLYSKLEALPPLITPLDRQNIMSGVLTEMGEDLRFPSLPLGRYRITVRAYAHAPGTVEALVVGGTETEARLTLRPPARLRVKFSAAESRIVRFQLLLDGVPVAALPEPGAGATPESDAPDGRPALAAGAGGVLLGGLANGTYVIEVLSEDLQPSRTSVRVREGETEEIEIPVRPR